MEEIADEAISDEPDFLKMLIEEIRNSSELGPSWAFARYQRWLDSYGEGLSGYSDKMATSLSVKKGWFAGAEGRNVLDELFSLLLEAQEKGHLDVAVVNDSNGSDYTLRYRGRGEVELLHTRGSVPTGIEGTLDELAQSL